MLHKQYGKKYLIICYYIQYRSVSIIFWNSHLVNSKDALVLAYCLPFGKAGELQILRCQGIEVNNYNFTLDALTLKPSGFCNVRVNTDQIFSWPGAKLYKLKQKPGCLDAGKIGC